jgi:uncharacterized membrane protein
MTTVTATSRGDPSVTAGSTLTTTSTGPPPSYGVSVNAVDDTLSSYAGDVVTYTLTVRNDGTADDSFTVSLSGNAWGTTSSIATVGPLGAGASDTLDVYVTIPTSAADGATDAVLVTLTSAGNPAESDAVTLTTTSTGPPSGYGVSVDAVDDTLSSYAGDVVTYTLTVQNDGTLDDSYTVSLSGNAWTTASSTVTVGPLGAGASDTLDVYVTIPGSAADGATDAVLVTLTSAGNPAESDAVTLTTTAHWTKLYLPMVVRNQ